MVFWAKKKLSSQPFKTSIFAILGENREIWISLCTKSTFGCTTLGGPKSNIFRADRALERKKLLREVPLKLDFGQGLIIRLPF